MTDSTVARIDCEMACQVPPGVSLHEVPPARHDWPDVLRCPNDGCGETFLVVGYGDNESSAR